MTSGFNITYDRESNALYIYFTSAESVSQRAVSEDVILDLDADNRLVGIELLDPGADLTSVFDEFGIDPHLRNVINKVRDLIPDAKKKLIFA
jgi:uncharacterized protein YuzE